MSFQAVRRCTRLLKSSSIVDKRLILKANLSGRIMYRRSIGILVGLLLSLVISYPAAAEETPATGLINRDAAVYCWKTGKIYLVDPTHDAVVAISDSGESRSIKVGAQPVAVAINQQTNRIYAVNAASRSVSVIDAETDEVIASVQTAARPYAVAVDQGSNKVYVSNTFSNMLTMIDGKTSQATNLPTGSADAILVDSDRSRVYLLGYETDTVTELNPATGAMSKLPAGAMHLWGMARSGGLLYVSHVQESSIGAIDPATHSVRNMATGAMPCAIAVDKKTGKIYVANYADGTVSILGKEGDSATVKVSARPQALTLDDGSGRLYVTSPQQNAVAVIDIKDGRVLRIYRHLDHPYAVAFSPVSHQAYAVSQGEKAFTLLK
jgi:YVTN family beta-propeller protein